MKQKKPIVIIGGMGPQASSALYVLLIEKSVRDYGVVANEDFPHIVLQSLSVPDFIGSRSRQTEALAIMKQAAQTAALLNPSIVAMACNTAHLFQDQLLKAADIPLVSVIELVANRVKASGCKRVGLVASPTTIRSGLYTEALTRRGVQCDVPTVRQQARLEAIIRAVIAGTATDMESRALLVICESLVANGAEAIVLGCTELPIVFSNDTASFPIFDCLDILAGHLLETYYDQPGAKISPGAII